jgi:membrane-anchored protein YejM (alkaline phosphatase superfamily)
MTDTIIASNLSKRTMVFYAIELISAVAFTFIEGFSGLIWLAVAISFIGIIPRLKNMPIIAQIFLALSSVLWGYIVMYNLTSAPGTFTVLLIARVIATLIGFKNIKDQMIVVIPLLIAFALFKPVGCVPPLDF